MKLVILYVGIFCLISGIKGQGFAPPPDPECKENLEEISTPEDQCLAEVQQNPYQRQLSVSQQSHILNDVQLHRFNVQNPSQDNQYLLKQKSIEIAQSPSQQHLINPRPPPPVQQQQQQLNNNIRFPQNNLRSNYQSNVVSGNAPVLQHHTQTSFIPNFVQPATQQTQATNQQYQRSLQNQLQLPSHPTSATNSVQQAKPTNAEHEFHAQNFLTLQNHFTQASNQQAVPSQKQQQFVQSQQQFQTAPVFSTAPQFGNKQIQNNQYQNVATPQNTQQFQSSSIPSNQQFVTGQQQPQKQQSLISPSQFQAAPQFSQTPPQFQQSGNQQFQQSANQQFQQVAPPQFQQVSGPQFQNQQFKIVNQYQQFPQENSQVVLTPEQEAKQKLIQKHEAFVQKQYEKQQNRVKQLHDDFVQKQQSLKDGGVTLRQPIYERNVASVKSRPLSSADSKLFDYALKKYYEEHPTTTTTTTAATKVLRNDRNEDPYERLLQAQRKDIYGQLKLESERPKSTKIRSRPKPTKSIGREELLKQLKLALAEHPQPSLGNKTFDSMDIVLPNGEKVQVIRTTDPNLISGASPLQNPELPIATRKSTSKKDATDFIKHVAPDHSRDLLLPNGEKVEIVRAPVPPSISGLKELPQDISSLYTSGLGSDAQIIAADGPPSIEELTKRGLIPEGYEIVQQPAPGLSQQPATSFSSGSKKPPTFVYLEEQPDGSFKVQGVKANGDNNAKTTGAEVDNILERIKQGDIQLPPAVTKIRLPGDEEIRPQNFEFDLHQRNPPVTSTTTTTTTTPRPTYPTTYRTSTSASQYTSSIPRVTFPSSTLSPYSTLSPLVNSPSTSNLVTASTTHKSSHQHYRGDFAPTEQAPSESTLTAAPNRLEDDLIRLLKANGLFAMAKYLKQSGLDTVLNETGPYTVFAPTDKAFKNLLIQLGGPERAEEKFKANPRLLSGLLLHHVIPGAFEISSLQDEMTGVSLAGTQLRVNQYAMHDQEWNDVLITTINGAMIMNEKQDIRIPQGMAHAVDRVMFPLPVGDLLQTLQSDRENRFTKFLKVLYVSGLSEMLQNKGTKTYTVFAPTDKAFGEEESAEQQKLYSDKEAAQAFAMRHITPGTLFSAGMRFYQVKDALLEGKTITLQKTSAGKIKVNESQMITSNIPATNGVIHALDGLL